MMTGHVERAPGDGKALTAEAAMSKTEYIRINLVLPFKGRAAYITLVGMLMLTAIGLTARAYWLLLPWLLLGFLALVNAFQAVRNALSRNNANFFLPCKYSFHDAGVNARTTLGEGRVNWGDFVKWEKAAGYYVLHARGRSFLAVPESAFSPPDAAALESLLRRKIG